MAELLSEQIYKRLNLVTDIVIYGTGIIAEKCYRKLSNKGYLSKVKCFTQTALLNKNKFCDLPVVEFGELLSQIDKYKTFFIIAVGNEDYLSEITDNLNNNHISEYCDGRKLIFDSLDCTTEELEERKEKIANYLTKEKVLFNHNKKIVASHVTYPFVGNAGDTYLSYCVRRFLGFDEWNIIYVSDPVNQKTIDSINQTDILIIGGGGLFLPDTNKNNISGWQWAISNELLEKITVPVFVFSVGYNYFFGQTMDDIFVKSVVKLAKKTELMGLRNRGSVNAIQEILPTCDQKKVVFQPCTTSFACEFLKEIPTPKNNNIIAINMAFDREEMRYGFQKEFICKKVAQSIKMIADKGYEIVCVAHCDGDFEFTDYLDKESVTYKKRNLSYCLPDEIIQFYRNCKVVIGMRGHAQMIPFGLDCNIITLGSHDKMKWFLQDINFMDMYIDLSRKEEIYDTLIKTFNYVVNNTEELKMRRKNACKTLYQISMQNKKKIEEAIIR